MAPSASLPRPRSHQGPALRPLPPRRPRRSAARTAPDLVPSALAVSATGPVQAGGQVSVRWTATNSGDAAPGSTRDRVLIRRADTGEIIAVQVTPPQAGLAIGASAARQAVLSLPSGAVGAGDLVAEVELDITNAANESDAGLAGELG